MAESNQRPEDLNPQPIPPGEKRTGVSPLIWILLLLALLALGWWFFQQRGAASIDAPEAVVPAEPAITSEQEAAATAERERAEQASRQATSPKPPADRAVEPIARLQPEYPPEAFRAREEGTVVLTVSVDAAGNPGDIEVTSRSGSRDLDRAATDAVRKWKFRPAIENGQAVASTVQVPIEFKLDRE